MKRVFLLKDYQLLNSTTKYAKTKTSEAIKSVLLASEKLNGEDCIVFSLLKLEDHENHLVGKNAKFSECLDDQIQKEIEELVQEGKRNVQLMQEYVKEHAKNVLQVDEEDIERHRYKPELKLIWVIIQRTKRKLQWCKIDQQNVTFMIEQWNKLECNVFFRPYVIEDSDDGTEMKHFKSKLFFVYQNRNMQRFYELYGKNSILQEL